MTDTTNGWPGKPGVPLNPEEPKYHWVKGCDGDDAIVFWRGHGGDTHHENGDLKELDHWSGYPMWMARDWTYIGPALSHDEATALQARVAELEGALEAAGRVLHKAGEQFSEYANKHAAYRTAVSDLKAATNKQWAERCFSAYWRAVEGGGE